MKERTGGKKETMTKLGYNEKPCLGHTLEPGMLPETDTRVTVQ